MEKNSPKNDWSNWTKIISKYNKPSNAKSWFQIANSYIPYIGLWIAMIYSIKISYWLTLALSILAAGFLVRIFIIFHDCGHGSFFKSPLLSRVVSIISGMLVFTPHHKWHHEHHLHHQTVGNLDKRGSGDVKTITVEEYKSYSLGKRIYYRIYRNPIIIFLIAPFFLFTIAMRFPSKTQSLKSKLYTHLTTLGLILGVILISQLLGLKTFLLIQIPILYFASVAGVWLFYLQHQFEDVIWERDENWDYKIIAMEGSSYLKLPKILQWFSGNIGFHHLHHLSPKIPNYNLEKCIRDNPIFQKEPLTFWPSIRSMRFRLWDEKKHKLVTFKEALSS